MEKNTKGQDNSAIFAFFNFLFLLKNHSEVNLKEQTQIKSLICPGFGAHVDFSQNFGVLGLGGSRLYHRMKDH